MNLLRKLFTKKSIAKVYSERPFTDKWEDVGVFEYNDDGFTITQDGLVERLKWNQITQLNVFKRDLLTIDRIDMEIVYGEYCLTINEELPGWYQFVLKTKEVFPTVPKDWDIKIIQPAFAANYSTIYQKGNETLTNIQVAKQKLKDAVNDYPSKDLTTSTALLVELYKSIDSPITLEKLQSYSNRINVRANAWEAESIASLLEVFNGFENKTLEEIIELVTKCDNY